MSGVKGILNFGGGMMTRRRRRNRRSLNSSTRAVKRLDFIALVFTIAVVYVLHKIAEALTQIKYFLTTLSGLEWTVILLLCFASVHLIWKHRNQKRIRQQKEQERLRLLHEQEQKRYMVRHKEMDKLKQMNPFEFERYIATLYSLMGFQTEVTKATGDGGKDIVMKKGEDLFVVECKRYNTPKVTRPDIQKFHSALLEVGAKEGFFVTTGEFTKPALDYVKTKPIHTINGESLLSLIEEFAMDETTIN